MRDKNYIRHVCMICKEARKWLFVNTITALCSEDLNIYLFEAASEKGFLVEHRRIDHCLGDKVRTNAWSVEFRMDELKGVSFCGHKRYCTSINPFLHLF